MQIRTKGTKIQLLRSVYLPERKRSTQRLVCTFHRWATSIPVEVRARLTDEEADQVAQWLEDRQAQEQERDRKNAVSGATFALDRATAALDAGEPISAAQLGQVRDSIKRLQTSLKKAAKRSARAKNSDSK